MSVIWDNDEIREKLLLLPVGMQEAFLRSVDRLYQHESHLMLNFIGESRYDLRDTQDEIEKEQSVLRDTSDLLASKRFFAVEEDKEINKDRSYEAVAVENYMKNKNAFDGSSSFHNEKHLPKSKKSKAVTRDKVANDEAKEKRKGSPSIAWVETESIQADERHKGHSGKSKNTILAWTEPSDSSAREGQRGEADRVTKDESKREKKNKREPITLQERSVSADPATDTMQKSRPLTSGAPSKTLEEQTEKIVREYLERDKSTVDGERLRQDEIMKKRREQKKLRQADAAEQLLQQAKLHEEASNKDKEALEQKMKEKLEMRRKRETSSVGDRPASVDDTVARVHGSKGSRPGTSDGSSAIVQQYPTPAWEPDAVVQQKPTALLPSYEDASQLTVKTSKKKKEKFDDKKDLVAEFSSDDTEKAASKKQSADGDEKWAGQTVDGEEKSEKKIKGPVRDDAPSTLLENRDEKSKKKKKKKSADLDALPTLEEDTEKSKKKKKDKTADRDDRPTSMLGDGETGGRSVDGTQQAQGELLDNENQDGEKKKKKKKKKSRHEEVNADSLPAAVHGSQEDRKEEKRKKKKKKDDAEEVQPADDEEATQAEEKKKKKKKDKDKTD